MDEIIEAITEILTLIPEMKTDFGIKRNSRDSDPLMFTGVATSSIIPDLASRVERHFGAAYKPAGEGAFFKNLFDSFVKSVGGISKEQTLYRKEFSPTLALFCAFWPWASDPKQTSVRLGLLCTKDDECERLKKALARAFR